MTTPKAPQASSPTEARVAFTAQLLFSSIKQAQEFDQVTINMADLTIALQAAMFTIQTQLNVCTCQNCIAERLDIAHGVSELLEIQCAENPEDERIETIRRDDR